MGGEPLTDPPPHSMTALAGPSRSSPVYRYRFCDNVAESPAHHAIDPY
jgi:hypothetical protein